MKTIYLCIALFFLDAGAMAQDLVIGHDLPYGNGQNLDIYRPATSRRHDRRPVVLLVHGGGFWEGDKRSGFYVQLAEAFARKGFVVISINYKLKRQDQPFSRAILDTCTADVSAAYAWLRRHSGEYDIDTTAVFIGGDSAGAGIVVNTCFDNPERFIGCIDLWGGLPGETGWEAPIYSRQFPATTPPTLIMHGTADRIIPYQTSANLYAGLSAAHVPASLIPLPGADHYPIQLASQIIDSMQTFMERVLRGTTRKQEAPLNLVNPYIGTSNSGNTNPGPVRPWGMVSVSPFNTYDPTGGHAGATPYIYGRQKIYGFTHLNMSGVGCGDLGIVCVRPGAGDVSELPEIQQKRKPGYAYSREKASPGYYAVSLDEPGVDVECTTTCRTSLLSFRYPGGAARITIDLGMGLTERKGGMLRLVSAGELEGCKNIGNMCGLQSMQTVYFVIRLSRPAEQAGVWSGEDYFEGFTGDVAGNEVGAIFRYHTRPDEKILVKTAFSYVSIANARANLDAEQPGFDFTKTLMAAEAEWSAQLSRIRVEGGSRNDRVEFYTALYHMLIHPGRADDVNGGYRQFDRPGMAVADSNGRYSVFSLWDTYRTLHPFLSLVYPRRESAMIKSLLGMARESGWLPRWEYAAIGTGAMTGDPSLPVIVDTWMRGIRDFDVRAAYNAMKRNATTPESGSYMRPGLTQWLRLGFIPEDDPHVLHPFDTSAAEARVYPFMKAKRIVWGCVSTPLEYCMADWTLAQLAKSLGYTDDFQTFSRRAMSYRNNFDPAIGLMLPRRKDGSWLSPFDPAQRRNNAFTEGTSWNYSFMVPYDIEGLIRLMGGPVRFRMKLDSCFDRGYFDITNEPDLAYPWLYNYLPGDEWRTGARLKTLRAAWFSNSPGGLPGNDDCGELSAWLVCTMMGIYPDCPGRPDYQLTAPVFDKIHIRLDPKYYPGGSIEIVTRRGVAHNTRVKAIRWNDRKITGYRIRHQTLVGGGQLFFTTE